MKTQVTRRSMATLMMSVLSLVVLAACQKQEGATPVGRAGSFVNANWAQQSNITLNGNVTTSDPEDYFHEAVSGFVAPLCNPAAGCSEDSWVGYVSPRAQQGTGVFIGGRVEMQAGVLNPNASTQMAIRGDSKLYVVVYDEYAGRADASGQIVPYISRAFATASGSVQGNHATLCFEEPRGVVIMEGTFSAQQFSGTLEYDNGYERCAQFNQQAPPKANTAAGVLGQFNVPTCQFFRCQ